MKKISYVFLILCVLFALVACKKKCEHNYIDQITTEASCTANGVLTYTCFKCNDSYTEEIPMVEHTYTSAVTKNPTCTEKGVKTFACSGCSASYTEEIEMVEHTFGEETVTKEPTCIEEGEKAAHCTACGATKVTGTIAVIDHQYSSKVTTEPTCTATGVRTYTCGVCSDSYTENVAKVNHNYESKVTTKATCTAEGVKTFTCSACSDSYTETIKKTSHKYTDKVTKAATCTETGTKVCTCKNCGHSYEDEIPAIAHKYTSKTTAAATCTTAGEKVYTCSSCGNSYTETIKAQGHAWAAATCTEAKKCTKCSNTEGSALGHNVKNGVCTRCGFNNDDAKKAAIEEENERHNHEIAEIEGYYDASISTNERTIDSLKSQYGIGYVSSASYYYNRQSSIRSEITDLSYKLAYSSSATEKARLQREINSLKEELNEINICLRIIDLEDENESLEAQRDIAIARENRTHQQNLADIETKYS